MRGRYVTAIAGVAVLLAGCGGSTHPAATSASVAPVAPPPINYGQQYLSIVAPYNTAVTAAQAQLAKLPSDPTVAQVKPITDPLIGKITDFDKALLSARWPANVETDIHALIGADSAVVSDLEEIDSGTPDVNQMIHDFNASGSAAALVRSDLGLPSNLGS